MSNLIGQYHTDKSDFVKICQDGVHLVIGQRKQTTPQKPKYYLLQRLSPSKHIYISSLYEWGEIEPGNPLQAYSFDFKGIDYVLMINRANQTATISLLTASDNSTFSINNVELGAKIDPNADF